MKKILFYLAAICLLLTSGTAMVASAMEQPVWQESGQSNQDEALDPQPKNGVIKIACAGDSITYGDKSSNAAYSYPSQLQKMLGAGYEVKNYGINAQTLTAGSWCGKYIDTQQSRNLVASQPDIIIIMLGTNDSQDICWINTNGKETFESLARELIQSYQKIPSNPKVYIATCPTADEKNQFKLKPDVIDNEIVPMQKRLAEELGCGLIDVNDFTKDFQETGLMTELYGGKPDLVHPNNDGYLQLAKFMFNGLIPETGLAEQDLKTYEIDSQNTKVKYEGGWGDWSDGALYMGTEKFVTAPGSSATLEFEGTGIQVTGIRTPQLSYMDVYLDGNYVQSVDTYISQGSLKHEPLYAIDSLADGKHTLRVELSAKKEAHHAHAPKISLDSFVIFREPQGFVDQISIRSEKDSFTMTGKGDKLQIYSDIKPASASDKKIVYKIIPAAAASVTESGLITANISEGSFYVYATAEDGSNRTARQVIKVGFEKEDDPFVFIDERDSSVTYTGTWTDKADELSYNATLKETHGAGNKVSVSFEGTGITVVGQVNRLSNYSHAEVMIDGTYRGIATFMHNKDDVGSLSGELLFTVKDLEPGSHTLTLTPQNNRPAAPSEGQCGVVLDGFRVYNHQIPRDKTELKAAILDAAVILKNAQIGTESGMYPQEAADRLQKVRTDVQEAMQAAENQKEIDGLTVQLRNEIQSFAASAAGTGLVRSLEVVQPQHGSIELCREDGSKLTALQVVNGSRVLVKLVPDKNYQLSAFTAGTMKKYYPDRTEGETSVVLTVTQDLQIAADFTYKKIRIACIGDSISYGACSTNPQENSYSAVLQKKLGDKYDVRNFAMPSACLRYDGGFPYTNQNVYQKSLDFEPDMVLIMLGTNDSVSANWNNFGTEGFKKDTRKLVNSYKALPSNPTVYLVTAPYTYSGRKQVIENEIVPAQRELAQQEGYPLIDMYRDTFELAKVFFNGDLVHYSDQGYAVMAEFMLEGLDVPEAYKLGDKSALYSMYYRYEGVTQSECTAATWPAFAAARDSVKTLLDKKSPLQSELTLAQAAFAEKTGSLQFNKKIKVACVGDSITYGAVANPREKYCYPTQLQGLLGNRYEVKNFGVNGRTMNDTVGAKYVGTGEYTNSKNYNPDIVIIMLGTNDSKKNNWQDATGEKTYTESGRRLLDSYRALPSNPKIYLATSPSVAADMTGSPDSDGEIIRNAVIHDKIVPLQKQLAAEYDCTLIDINQKTEALEDLYVFLSSDRIHPHNEGYTLLASYMYNGVSPVPVYRADLQDAVDEAAKISLDDQYVLATVERFREALEDAKAMLADETFTSADQPKIMEAARRLKAASDGLLKKADKSGLLASVNTAKKINLAPYTKETADKVAEALKKAEALLADEGVSAEDQAEVNAAKTALDDAVKGLVKQADKSGLLASVNTAKKINLALYTKETADKVTEALKEAEKLLADAQISEKDQTKINTAKAVLDTAVKNLTKIPQIPADKKVEKITLNPSSVKLVQGKGKKLRVSILPLDAANKNLKWTTSNKKIAVINANGTITAKGVGAAVITAQAQDGSGKKQTVKVTVVPKPVNISKVKKAGSNSVKLIFTRKIGITRYEFQSSLKKKSNYVSKGKAPGKEKSFTVQKLKRGKTYYFRMRAIKKIGKASYPSSWSKPVRFRIK